jgi:hypothetical protein
MNTQTPTGSLAVNLFPIANSRDLAPEPTTRGSELRYTADFSHSSASETFLEVTAFRQIDTQIFTFTPEPYIVKHPIGVTLIQQGNEWVASHFESNIHASGDNEVEALENLKSLMLDTFDSLTSEPEENLGPKPKCQLAVLRELIERA